MKTSKDIIIVIVLIAVAGPWAAFRPSARSKAFSANFTAAPLAPKA